MDAGAGALRARRGRLGVVQQRRRRDPDIVLACAGDIATQETVAAAWLLRQHLPELTVRVVNVVDLMALCPPDRHPHGMDPRRVRSTCSPPTNPSSSPSTATRASIHQLIHGRPDTDRFHVRGYIEEGTTTTPFDMVVLNHMSRVHLCMDAIQYAPQHGRARADLIALANETLGRHRAYISEHFEDLPGNSRLGVDGLMR